jgi:hypothetical protein
MTTATLPALVNSLQTCPGTESLKIARDCQTPPWRAMDDMSLTFKPADVECVSFNFASTSFKLGWEDRNKHRASGNRQTGTHVSRLESFHRFSQFLQKIVR